MAIYLIIGAGRFGRLALARLQERQPQAQFWVVDQDPAKLAPLANQPSVRVIEAPAVAGLAQALAQRTRPTWIIPAVPLHLAFAWLLLTPPPGADWQQLPVPLKLGQDLPFCQRGSQGEVYLSLATGRCPDDCPEPATRCSLTGVPRQRQLFAELQQTRVPGFQVLVLRSRQLAPGVGGYQTVELYRLRDTVWQATGKMIICTACRCHGVCHGLVKVTQKEAEVGL